MPVQRSKFLVFFCMYHTKFVWLIAEASWQIVEVWSAAKFGFEGGDVCRKEMTGTHLQRQRSERGGGPRT